MQPKPDTMTCKQCLVEKPFDADHFMIARQCKYGLRRTCKDCINMNYNVWYLAKQKGVSHEGHEVYKNDALVVGALSEKKYWKDSIWRQRAIVLRAGMSNRARERKLPFDRHVLTSRFIMDWLVNQPACDCCGREFIHGTNGYFNNSSPTFDRYVPHLGYVIGNLALICWRCNNLKRDATIEELETVVRWMRSRSTAISNQAGLLDNGKVETRRWASSNKATIEETSP